MQNPADQLASDDRNSQKKTQASYLRHYHAGVEFFVAVGLMTWGGWWLDKHWGTLPVFTLLGLALGFGGGFRALYKEVYGSSSGTKSSGKKDSGTKSSGTKSSAASGDDTSSTTPDDDTSSNSGADR